VAGIRPHLGSLTGARGRVPTPKGPVEVRWQREQPGNIGYDAVAAGGRLYVPVLWDFTLDRESGGTLVALAN
jgi:acetamidase/formamidase